MDVKLGQMIVNWNVIYTSTKASKLLDARFCFLHGKTFFWIAREVNDLFVVDNDHSILTSNKAVTLMGRILGY